MVLQVQNSMCMHDGAYMADNPLGPYVYMPNSPFSYKPGGFNENGVGEKSEVVKVE